MNKTYILHLGHEPYLSQLEWERQYPLSPVTIRNKKTGLVEIDETQDVAGMLNILGGIIKISEKLETVQNLSVEEKIADLIRPFLHEDHKNTIALSVEHMNFNTYKRLMLDIKKTLKQSHSIRVVFPKKGTELNSGELEHNHLVGSEYGIEINALNNTDGTYDITRTVAMHDFEHFRKRDLDRPSRRRRAGLLSPKFALMLVNIAGLSKGTIYDPFCGDGTIVQEALVRGFDGIGSDIAQDAVESTEVNLKWLQDTYSIPGSWSANCADALKINAITCDAVVTEGDLGRPLNTFATPEEADDYFCDHGPFYTRLFKTYATQTTAKTVVMCIPAFQMKNGFVVTVPEAILNDIEKTGWRLDETVRNYAKRLTYLRKEQYVGRTVTLWKRTER